MINEVYAIYDDASECFVQFFNCQNEKIARMTFEKLFKEKRLNIPMIFDYPNTFSVHLIATFDDKTGLYENISPQKLIFNFGSLISLPKSTVDVVSNE